MEPSMKITIFRIVAMLMLWVSATANGASAPSQKNLDSTIRSAQNVVASLEGDPMQSALRARLKEAKAILILSPGLDRGVVMAHAAPDQAWSAPAFYRVSRLVASGRAGGAGFTAGKQELELIALAMTDRAFEWLNAPKAPGTSNMVIRHAEAVTTGQEGSNVDVWLFSRSNAADALKRFREIFAVFDKEGNQSYYGKALSAAEIFSMQNAPTTEATSLQKAVTAVAQ